MSKFHFLLAIIGLCCFLSSCKTGFNSQGKKYRKGFLYGEKQLFKQSNSEFIGLGDYSVNSQSVNFSEDKMVEPHATFIPDSVSQIQDLSHSIHATLHIDGVVSEPLLLSNENRVIQVEEPFKKEKSKSKNEERAMKFHRLSLYMYLPIGILFSISILSIFIPGALYLMLIALALMFPFIVLMMLFSIKAFSLSDAHILRRKSAAIFISGFIIILVGLASAAGLYLLGLMLGNFPLN
jgi:hypothetical protein